jgi:hypothetical protein
VQSLILCSPRQGVSRRCYDLISRSIARVASVTISSARPVVTCCGVADAVADVLVEQPYRDALQRSRYRRDLVEDIEGSQTLTLGHAVLDVVQVVPE